MSFIDPLKSIELQNGDLSIGVLNYGARTTFIRHRNSDLALYYPDPQDYVTGIPYVGAIVGRVANRISRASFEMDGKQFSLTPNEGRNQLHGGPQGLSQKFWNMDQLSPSLVQLTHTSTNGEEGYPAKVAFTVEIELFESALEYRMSATSSAATPINLAQHNYYAIDIEKSELQVPADHYTPVDEEQIPTGALKAVANTTFDYRRFSNIAPDIDHNLVLNEGENSFALKSANCVLSFTTDQPGLQVYSGAGLSAPFEPNSGLALEPQYFPNAVNQEGFEMPLTTPEAPYHQVLRIEINPI